MVMAFPKQELKVEVDPVKKMSRPEEPINPGRPLGEADCLLASKLPEIRNNMTVKQLKRNLIIWELIGSKMNERIPKARSGMAEVRHHWPNAIVPYEIDARFTQNDRAHICKGFKHVEDNSCIRFVPRQGEHDYMDIVVAGADRGCYAQIPYFPGVGRMEMGLEQQIGCTDWTIVIHELLHILGMKHEQSRPDRDEYITINWDNFDVEQL